MKMRTIENRTIFHRDGTISYYSRTLDRYVRNAISVSAYIMPQFDEATATKIVDRLSEKDRRKGEMRKSVACKMVEKIFFHEIRYFLGREPKKGEMGYLLPHGEGRYLRANIIRQKTGDGIRMTDGTTEYVYWGRWTVPDLKRYVQDWIRQYY